MSEMNISHPLRFLCISSPEKSHCCLCLFFYRYEFFSLLYSNFLYIMKNGSFSVKWVEMCFPNWHPCFFFRTFKLFYSWNLKYFVVNLKSGFILPCNYLMSEVNPNVKSEVYSYHYFLKGDNNVFPLIWNATSSQPKLWMYFCFIFHSVCFFLFT